MSKTSIDLELDKRNKSKLSKFEKQNGNELLMLKAPSQDLEVLRRIGLDTTLRQVEQEQNTLNALVTLEDIYNSPVYLGADIMEICHLYNLKLVTASKYKGRINNELAEIINKFVSEAKTDVSLYYDNFFILGPAENFYEEISKSTENCTLFYREENRGSADLNERFIKVHSWGENHSFLRRFRWMFNINAEYKTDTSFQFAECLFLFIYLCIFGALLFISSKDTSSIMIGFGVVIYGLRSFYNLTTYKELGIYDYWNRLKEKY